ncbi:hypothetical protein DH2020_042812 [Rehmannia glutinosa]|uniref:Glutathione hydrolase n=1 Tax=Rehmannia glutinosa TaxID=99300 RepID=A0ABR0UMN1_REHGL
MVQLYPNVLYIENYASKYGDRYEYPSGILEELKQKGHVLQGVRHWTACQFVIQRLNGPNASQLVAVSDPRKVLMQERSLKDLGFIPGVMIIISAISELNRYFVILPVSNAKQSFRAYVENRSERQYLSAFIVIVDIRDGAKKGLGWMISSANKSIIFLLLFSASILETTHAGGGERVVARNGVVATDETECSKIGRDILRQGGHAVDAAVAATLCLGVVGPSFSGIGGGGFMLVRSSSGDAKVFDMREMAPGRASKIRSEVASGGFGGILVFNGLMGRRCGLRANHQIYSYTVCVEDMFGGDRSKWQSGPLSIAFPGQIAGLFTAHQKYGKIPWETLVKPAENLARNGFNISSSLFNSMYSAKSTIMANKELRSIFAPNGELLLKGKTLRFRKLADTLASISKYGMNMFYNGSIAKNLAEDIQKAGGIITKEDFQKYHVISRKPLVANVFGKYQVVTAPPPTSGGAMMILILNILSNYNAIGVSRSRGNHRLIEALKYALALRMNLGDPGFVNATNVLENMISTSFAKKLKNLINDKKTFDPAHYGSKWSQLYDHGTSHVCVVDSQRNVVTMTISLNSYFGSKMVSPSTGIFLNNQMYDFSIPTSSEPPPSPANFIQPFKRPLSSMTPTIILKRTQIKAVIGAAGGLLIPDAVTEVLVNYFNREMDPLRAVKYPRFYHMLYPNVLYHEDYKDVKGDHHAFKSRMLDKLKRKGHVLRKASAWTVCQFVVQKLEGPDSGQLIAVSDQRKGGFPVGY